MQANSPDSQADTATSKGVFSFTEVITEKLTLPPIPGVFSQLNSPTFHHKSASLPRFRSPEPLQPGRSRLELLDQEVLEEFQQEAKQRLRRLDGSMLMSGEVALAKQVVRDTKSRFDTIVMQRRAKERILSKLYLESAQISTISQAEPDKNQEILQLRESELEETLQACKNELHYRQTLLYMLEIKQKYSLFLQEPLRLLRDDLEKTTKDLNLRLKRTLELEAGVESIGKQTDSMHLTHQTAREYQETMTKTAIDRYKAKQKLLLSLQFERKELNTLRSIHKMQDLASVLETKLASLQAQEQHDEEIKALNQRSKAEERKFKAIQQRTNIASLLDMEPYWRYLSENKETLERAVESAEKSIEELQGEREKWRLEMKKSIEEENTEYLSREEVAYMDSQFQEKEKELKGSEAGLQPLQDLVIAATNATAQLTVLVERTDLDVKPSNVRSCLAACEEAIEGIVKAGPRVEVPPSPTLGSMQSLQLPGIRQKRRKTTRRSVTSQLSP